MRDDDVATSGTLAGGTGLEEVWAVRDALAALPHDLRLAVVLRYWLGCDVAEAAELADCAEATLRSRAFRGLARLRADLGDLTDDSHASEPVRREGVS